MIWNIGKLGALFDYQIYVFLKGHHVVIFWCLKDETPHKQHVKEKFWEWKCQEGHFIWVPQKNKPQYSYIAHTLIFFIKYYMILKSNILFLVLKKEHPQTYSRCFNDVLTFCLKFCLSLEWKIHFNLDFVLKSFRCSKRDVWRVLLTTLRNESTKLLHKKAGWWSYRKLTQSRRYGEWFGMWKQWLVIFIFCFYFSECQVNM